MSAALRYILSGLSIGAIYSLVGLGFNIMWASCRAGCYNAVITT